MNPKFIIPEVYEVVIKCEPHIDDLRSVLYPLFNLADQQYRGRITSKGAFHSSGDGFVEFLEKADAELFQQQVQSLSGIEYTLVQKSPYGRASTSLRTY